MSTAFGQMPAMTLRNRALTQTIVYGVLRWQRRIDATIAHFSKTKLNRIHPIVLNLLRIGIFQIFYLDRIPASAAVNTTVQLTKAHAPTWVVGFVNALLREANRSRDHISISTDSGDTVDKLAVDKSFPSWLIKRWVDRFGEKETAALCDEFNTIPDITIRVNTLKCQRQQAKDALHLEATQITATAYSPLGLSLTGLKRSLDQMVPFKSGFFQVQDEAAQLITYILDPKPQEAILDACAGLGGKTGHIAQAIENRGYVVAADNSTNKLDCLKQEMQRLGINCVKTYIIDWNLPAPKLPLPQFDRILLDAPCSGIGVIRRNPDIKWRNEKFNLQRYAQRQRIFLEHMAPLVKPGGVIVYAVCSFEPEENEFVINGFLKNHSEFAKEYIRQEDSYGITGLGCNDGFLRTLPHHHPMDGFFVARLRKNR
jgi:16S rRNA (cytosine967-C5)-methyltransferase